METAADYSTARTKAFLYEYDCILLDIMLPDGDGLTLLRELSARGRRGNVIIISAKDSIDDKVAGLELGADDYLAKPSIWRSLTHAYAAWRGATRATAATA